MAREDARHVLARNPSLRRRVLSTVRRHFPESLAEVREMLYVEAAY
jgi:hypothetical protein